MQHEGDGTLKDCCCLQLVPLTVINESSLEIEWKIKGEFWVGLWLSGLNAKSCALVTQVRVPVAARDFRVQFQGRLSHGVRTAPVYHGIHQHLCAS